MSTTNALTSLTEWYAQQCDGEWEHSYGVRIDTLDNPGWRVVVDLVGTAHEGVELERQLVENSEEEWMSTEIRDDRFVGAGDPTKLVAIIEAFLAVVR